MYKTVDNWEEALNKKLPDLMSRSLHRFDYVLLGLLRFLTIKNDFASLEELQTAMGHKEYAHEMKQALNRLMYASLVEEVLL